MQYTSNSLSERQLVPKPLVMVPSRTSHEPEGFLPLPSSSNELFGRVGAVYARGVELLAFGELPDHTGEETLSPGCDDWSGEVGESCISRDLRVGAEL